MNLAQFPSFPTEVAVAHAYIQMLGPDGLVAAGLPEADLLVVAAGQEDGLGGMDGQAPQLISVALGRDEDRLGSVCSSIITDAFIKSDLQ